VFGCRLVYGQDGKAIGRMTNPIWDTMKDRMVRVEDVADVRWRLS
jgi:hypothetical protein